MLEPLTKKTIHKYISPLIGPIFGAATLPKYNLLMWCKNQFDSDILAFNDRMGSSTRQLHDLQYIQADGTGYFLNRDMVTAGLTITSTTTNGTATLSSPSAGRLNMTAGTAWDFTVTWSDAVVSSYAYCSLVTATYAVCFDRSGNGRHLVATGFSTLSSVCVSGREFGSDVLNLYGWSAGGLGPELVVNGNFDINTNNWNEYTSTNYYVSNGRLYQVGNEQPDRGLYQTIFKEYRAVGRSFRVNASGNNGAGGNPTIDIVGVGLAALQSISSYPYIYTHLNNAQLGILLKRPYFKLQTSIHDNVSLKENYPSTVPIPAQTLNPSLDALGNALTYTGRAKYSIVPKGRAGNCATLASGTSIAITGVTEATVLSKEGTGTVTIGTNVINRDTDGTLYNLKLTLSTGRVLTLPLTEGAGTTVWGYDNTGQVYTGTITASDINAFWAGKQSTYFHGLQYGCSIGRWSYLDNTYKDEPTSTNLVKYSQDFSNSVWTVFHGTTKISHNNVAPDGSPTASIIRFPLSVLTAQLYCLHDNLTSGTTYTISVYAKSGTGATTTFRLKGQISTGDVYSSDFTATTEWQRFQFSYTEPSTSNGRTPSVMTNSTGTTGDLIIWGFQLEARSSATSYIPTTTASATEYNGVWPANPGTGNDLRGNALTNPPLKWNDSADYTMPDADQVRKALGWTYGTANYWYNGDGTSKELTLDNLYALGTGFNFYMGAGGLAVYGTPQIVKDASIEKSLKVPAESYGDAFVMTFNIASDSETLTIPCQNVGTFNATIDWGDGSTSTITAYNDANLVHVYSKAGQYDVRISGVFPNIYFNNTGDRLKLITIKNFGNTGFTILNNAFYGCTNLVSVTSKVTNTSLVTNMTYMFRSCSSLTALDVSGFDTSLVTNMDSMFCNCSSLTALDVSGFDTSLVTNMTYMFCNCSSLTALDVSGFDTSLVTNMSSMFNGCYSLTALDVSGFNIEAINNIANLTNFARNVTISTVNYDATLINWVAQNVLSGLTPNFGTNTKYTPGGAAEAARNYLINTKGWTITDGGPVI